jgi:hypothetical protein
VLRLVAGRIAARTGRPSCSSFPNGPFANLSTSDRAAPGASFASARAGEAEDIANLAAFVVSAEAGFVIGQASTPQAGNAIRLRASRQPRRFASYHLAWPGHTVDSSPGEGG